MNPQLPTLERLGSSVPEGVSPSDVAQKWLEQFSTSLQSNDIPKTLSLLVEDGFWRDFLAFTWDFRTFHGANAIQTFLDARLAEMKPNSFQLSSSFAPRLSVPYPDLAWIEALFNFETQDGQCSGVVRLVPLPGQTWKAFSVFTNLDGLKAFPETIGHLRNHLPNHGTWLDNRLKEAEFADKDPTVVIIGAGQSGLDIAARLKHLDVPTLIIEKNQRVGDTWRQRYQSLCLHDPVWYEHLPYIPFPPSWPVYTPALKLADWLESYANSLELNIWTSATLHDIKWNEGTKSWTVRVTRSDGKERILTPKHVVMAVGLASGQPNIPDIPGMAEFEGKIVHATEHKTAKDYLGKKAVVIGAATSGHDVAYDFHNYGVDVTLYQDNPNYIMTTKNGGPHFFSSYTENEPPVDIADRLFMGIPVAILRLLHQRVTKHVKELDK